MHFLGIDPGKSGGLAVVDKNGLVCESVGFKNLTDTDINDWLLSYEFAHCVLEKVHSMPTDGKAGIFTFGENYGLLRGMLIANKIRHELIPPQQWQKEFGLIQRGKKLTNTQKKNINKAKAQELFPQVKVTHAIADALLIAEYTRRKFK